jgi:hypothetical protein
VNCIKNQRIIRIEFGMITTRRWVRLNNPNNMKDLDIPRGENDHSTDPLGSYTGLPEDPFEKPVQDADDL